MLAGAQEFPADYKAFQAKVEDLERRLGAIACQAFDDANGPEAAFKVVFVLGSLLERPIIAHDFESRYFKLVAMVDAEMDEAKRIYDEYYKQIAESGSQQHEKNMPPISGALKWSSELFDRISAPVSNMRHLEHECASPLLLPPPSYPTRCSLFTSITRTRTLLSEYTRTVLIYVVSYAPSFCFVRVGGAVGVEGGALESSGCGAYSS